MVQAAESLSSLVTRIGTEVGTDFGKMDAAAAKLLDSSQPIDVPLLDQVVTTAFDAGHPQVR